MPRDLVRRAGKEGRTGELGCRSLVRQALDSKRIDGNRGVIAFEIGFADATGHFDLWFRDRLSHEASAGKDDFALACRLSLWHDGSRVVSAPVRDLRSVLA